MASSKQMTNKNLALNDRLEPDGLLVAADILEDRGFADAADVLRNAHVNIILRKRLVEGVGSRYPRVSLFLPSDQWKPNVLAFKSMATTEMIAYEATSRVEKWLVECEVNESNANLYKLVCVDHNYPDYIGYRLMRLDDTIASELSINLGDCILR